MEKIELSGMEIELQEDVAIELDNQASDNGESLVDYLERKIVSKWGDYVDMKTLSIQEIIEIDCTHLAGEM